jgi:hypothetical protein
MACNALAVMNWQQLTTDDEAWCCLPGAYLQDRRGEMQEHAVLGTGRTLLK